MKITATCLLFIALAGAADAQIGNSNFSTTVPNAQAGAYYYVARPNEMTMQVNIWGFVQHPGRYEVATATDLVQLLSYAGGPTPDADIEDVKITRIIRKDGHVFVKELRLDMERLDRVDEGKLMLQPGDTIFIDHTSWVTVRDIVGVVTTAAIVTAAVAQVLNYTK
ncbi:MAG: SLBB domain-containing protein [Ignavibacteriae bacterium]|nr:SLBB domain-containing protein [Ignavibacteriota bacterium]